MDKLHELPKEKLIEIIKIIYENVIKDPLYKIYSKSFFIEYLKNILEVYKRYENLKIDIIVCKFNADKTEEIKKHLRKSDLIAKYDNLFVILIFQTMQSGLLKVKHKIEKLLNEESMIINIKIQDSLKSIIEKINQFQKIE
jgi:hypothetical protein